MRQDVTHFQLSALSNEDHVSKKKLESDFMAISLIFNLTAVRILCRHVLLPHELPTCQWILPVPQATQLSQWKWDFSKRVHPIVFQEIDH